MSKWRNAIAHWQAAGILATRLYQARECRALLVALDESTDWHAARVASDKVDALLTGEVRPELRSAEVNLFDTLPQIGRRFRRRIEEKLVPLIHAGFGQQKLEVAETSAIRYRPGGKYLPHIDNGQDLGARAFSVVCYLNDDFAGGETDFPILGMRATPQQGWAIAFPSEYLHAALPIVTGTKQVLVGWLHAPPAIAWI